MIAALLLGRKGSVGFPGKNLHPLLGRSLMEYPLLAAKHAHHVDHVYVSTDDEIIMDIAGRNGANVIVRPPELASKTALGEHAYVHGYRVISEKLKAQSSKGKR
jgi:CMP-N-acetylneuraminic acid synthetase